MKSRRLETQIDEERWSMRLASVCSPMMLESVLKEVERRKELFTSSWWKGSNRNGSGRTALSCALESVCQDVCKGWL